MATNSSDEVKQRNVDMMGKEIGEVFTALNNELAHLHMIWKTYVNLYGAKSSRIDLLNQAAASFFGRVQDLLWENILLRIARLTDNVRTAGKENLTIQLLPDLVGDKELKANLLSAIEEAESVVQFSRDHRNKLYAHRDLQFALEPEIHFVEGASRGDVKIALDALGNILNLVSSHYCQNTILYGETIYKEDELGLLYILDDGLTAASEMLEKVKSGKLSLKDEKQRDL